MSDVMELRSRIQAALAANGLTLGTATLPGGAPTPAINQGDWPDGTVMDHGLEVQIAKTPVQRAIDAQVFLGYVTVWPVRLIAWPGAPDLEDVANAIAATFWPLDQDPQVLSETDFYPEQVLLSIVL